MLRNDDHQVTIADFIQSDQVKTSLLPYCSLEVARNLCQTSHQLNTFFKPNLQPVYFVEAVVLCNREKVKRIAEENPTLLTALLTTKVSEVVDYSGRSYKNVTALEAALYANDIDTCNILLSYFDQIPNGRKIALEQCNNVFPVDPTFPVGNPKFGNTPYFDFTKIHSALLNSSDEEAKALLFPFWCPQATQQQSSLCSALNDFRAEFTAQSLQDRIFNPRHFIRASSMLGSHDGVKDELFLTQVIGFVQRFFPACYAIQFSTDARYKSDATKSRFALNRLVDAFNRTVFFPLQQKDAGNLGYDFAVSAYGCIATDPNYLMPGSLYSHMDSLLRERNEQLRIFIDELKQPQLQNKNTL